MKRNVNYLLIAGFMLLQGAARTQNRSILSFGAVGDGQTMNTVFIQKAVDACSAAGGGTVEIPSGRFLTGTLHLKNGVRLHLAEGSVLLGSTHRSDYEKIRWYALILADKQHDIGISGKGTIDGQGAALAQDVIRMWKEGAFPEDPGLDNRPHEHNRPQLIEFVSCKNIQIDSVTLQNSSCWVQTYDLCEDLWIRNIHVESMAYWNNDGIDLSDCSRVHVSGCVINAADDGICLKSHHTDKCCDDIDIRNCRVRSSASAVKFGTASNGGFRNVRIRNIEVYDTYRSALALEIVDGGFMENIDVDGINAVNTGNAVFIRLGRRNTKRPVGRINGVHIRNIRVEVPNAKPDTGYPLDGPPVTEAHNLIPASIVGLPDAPVRDVSLENIEIVYGGGGNAKTAEIPLDSLDKVPERPAAYPEFSMFGELPAWAFYVRHVSGLTMRNCRFTLKSPDFRPATVVDDVEQLIFRRIKIKGDSKDMHFCMRHVRAFRTRGLKGVVQK